ncbi:MAG: YajQ family cyclic di-GMP-binding protein [Gammaproteobacteria bacterium]|nr:YajQ family cyclic di-GMP-binding protein [Gammaproteobacteria bacterium]TVQ45850.1 MAG: YajQ family cyclic di-GMP-binding protein [Gammaproteobacteria bacterium]
MPSFDVVSEVDMHEVRNGVDQANREIGNRFDFKGADARVELEDNRITLHAEVDFQLQQMQDILLPRLAKRGVDIGCLDTSAEPVTSGQRVYQVLTIRSGIDQDLARKIGRLIKDSKLKVQTAVQGEKLRVTGKKRDDLQQVIALLKQAELDLPLQYENFRD